MKNVARTKEQFNKLFSAIIFKNINKLKSLRYYFGGQTLFIMKGKG
jgi:hypothetical protein